MTYDLGDLIRLSGKFTDLNGAPKDPTETSCQIRQPSGDLIELHYGTDANMVHAGVGSFYTDFAPTMPGVHYYRFAGTGDVVAAEEAAFYIRKREAF